MSQTKISDSHFEVLLADTVESKKIHYKLRYQVYCDEKRFEDKKEFPNGMEIDEWDNDATHFLIRHKYTGQYLGALRLARSLQHKLPFEKHSLPYSTLNNEKNYSSVEISRLCVIKETRKPIPRNKATECLQDPEIKSSNIHDYRPVNHELMWRMIRAAALYSFDLGLKEWYILVSPALAFTIQKAGFMMTQIGHSCQYRGTRTPYLLDVDQVLSNPFWHQGYQNGYVLYSELSHSMEQARLTA